MVGYSAYVVGSLATLRYVCANALCTPKCSTNTLYNYDYSHVWGSNVNEDRVLHRM